MRPLRHLLGGANLPPRCSSLPTLWCLNVLHPDSQWAWFWGHPIQLGPRSRSPLHLSLTELLVVGSVSLQKESPGLRLALGAPWCLLIWPLPPVSSPGSNACASWPCSLLCLPKADGGRSCRCPDGVSSSVLPSGDLMCECPHGYQLKNHTCVKEGASPSSFSTHPPPLMCP